MADHFCGIPTKACLCRCFRAVVKEEYHFQPKLCALQSLCQFGIGVSFQVISVPLYGYLEINFSKV